MRTKAPSFFLPVFFDTVVAAESLRKSNSPPYNELTPREFEDARTRLGYSPLCVGTLPVQRWWTQASQRLRILNNQQMCTLAEHGGDIATNLGGTCHQGTGCLQFDLENRYDAFAGTVGLVSYCRAHCECLDSDDEAEFDQMIENEPSNQNPRASEFTYPFDLPGRVEQQGGSTTHFSSFCANRPDSDVCRSTATRYRNTRPTCGRETHCDANFKCSAAAPAAGARRRGGCSCMASNFDINSGFMAVGCGVLRHSRSRLDGRDVASLDDSGCPCNNSYVSAACCKSTDGLVWEGSHLKLGELAAGFEGLV
jgi:hypothetical protein